MAHDVTRGATGRRNARFWSAVLSLGCALVEWVSNHMPPPVLPAWDAADLERCLEFRARRRDARAHTMGATDD